MPPAQPSPAEKPTRRSAKQKPEPTAAAAAPEPADLMTEIQFLRGLIEGLQKEVADLRAERQTEHQVVAQGEKPLGIAHNPLTSEAVVLELPRFEEPLADFQESEPDLEPEPANETEAVYAPYEPLAFAEDFAAAFDDPEPIDWGNWSESDGSEGALEASADWSESDDDEKALGELVQRHPGLIEEVIAFNQLNPPDFDAGPSFDLAVRQADTEGRIDRGRGSTLVQPADEPMPSVHDLMAELVAEASMSPAVVGSEDPFDASTEDLSGFAHHEGTSFSNPSMPSFGEEDFSYAPASPNLCPPKRLDDEIIQRAPALAAIRACLLPLDLKEGELTAGAPRPYDLEAIKEFEIETGLKVQLVPMTLEEVIQGLREGYSTKDEEEFRCRLLSGAAPPVPKTLLERASEFLPFLKRSR